MDFSNLANMDFSQMMIDLGFSSIDTLGKMRMKPCDVRTDGNVPWQQYYKFTLFANDQIGTDATCIASLAIQHLTDSSSKPLVSMRNGYKIKDNNGFHSEAILVDEVKQKIYYLHGHGNTPELKISELTVEIKKELDGSRTISQTRSERHFFGDFGFKPHDYMITSFLNPYDGNIFQLRSISEVKDSSVASVHTLSWVKLDDTFRFRDNFGDFFDGEVKVLSHCQFENSRFNMLDPAGCGILFSENGKKLLMRFRVPNPDTINSSEHIQLSFRRHINSCKYNFSDETNKPPTYAIFGINNESHEIQLLTQFVPQSVENHGDLLISTRLLAIYGNAIGFPNSLARHFLSQRSHMIGQYLKYTFFSTINKKVIGILAVKSLIKTLQNGQLSLTPKKVWFPLEDDKVKTAFANLSEKIIKWNMLSLKTNDMLVYAKEFLLQVYPENKHKATIRVKLGEEYKDYRKCAECGKIEKHKCRSKNGKRISQFKVCGWCKDHNLHKMWWDIPCHYCCEKCFDDHWPIHQLHHEEEQSKEKKGKGKKKKEKKKGKK